MLRSGSALLGFRSGNLSRSGSTRMQRDNSSLRIGGEVCTKYNLVFNIQTIECISIIGDVVIVLEKTNGQLPVTKPTPVDTSSRTATFRNQQLIAEVQFSKTRSSKRTGLKPKLIKVVVRSNNAEGPVITSSYFNATLYTSTSPPGEKVRIQLDDGSSVITTVASVPAAENCPITMHVGRESPTSVMEDGFAAGNASTPDNAIIKGTLKMMQGLGSIRDLRRRSTQSAQARATSLEELQKENSRLHKLIAATRKTIVNIDELKKEQVDLKFELEQLQTTGLETAKYLDFVLELCIVREAKARLQMDKEHLQFTLSELLKPSPAKKSRNKKR